jgi:hypothetical protein
VSHGINLRGTGIALCTISCVSLISVLICCLSVRELRAGAIAGAVILVLSVFSGSLVPGLLELPLKDQERYRLIS